MVEVTVVSGMALLASHDNRDHMSPDEYGDCDIGNPLAQVVGGLFVASGYAQSARVQSGSPWGRAIRQ
jgi:hypothetical protein